MIRTINPIACREINSLGREEKSLDRSRSRFIFNRKVREVVGRRYLGIGWLILNPVVNSLVYLFVFTVVRSNPDAAILLTGISMYTIFSNSFKSGMNSLKDFSGGLKAERVRTRVLTYAMLNYRLFDTILQSTTVAIILFFGLDIDQRGILFFVISCLALSVMSEGFGLNISTTVKRIPDFSNLINYALLLGFFASPALYSFSSTSGFHREINSISPFTIFVEAARGASGLENSFNLVWNSVSISILVIFGLLSIRGYRTLDRQRWEASTWS